MKHMTKSNPKDFKVRDLTDEDYGIGQKTEAEISCE